MNRINIFLNDKEIIEQIAKDPEVQIKIKNAILEGAIKRVAKLKEGISEQIAKTLKDEMCKPSGWSLMLKDEFKEAIKRESVRAVESFVKSEVSDLVKSVQKETNYYKGLIMAKLESIDIDKVIREEVRKAVNEKFK